jgi:NAD(P)-dependent dehydrogenase (short-subunit alcohol dehydrogenase family)
MHDVTAVVTGGSMGIGLACARQLVRDGYGVAICARGREGLAAAEAELRGARGGGRVRAVAADVAQEGEFERVLAAAEELGPVAGVVHAAAVLGPIGRAVDGEAGAWLEAVRTNLFGSFLVARASCRHLISHQRPGSVVLFSGGGATGPFPNYTAYACGKVGVVRLAETLAQEVAADGIRVNCVAPGFVATRMHAQTLQAGEAAGHDYLARTKQELENGGVSPELAARAVAFLLSDAAKGITGRLLAAPWDDWKAWPQHLHEIEGSDLFTLRRIVPRDRGKDWQ